MLGTRRRAKRGARLAGPAASWYAKGWALLLAGDAAEGVEALLRGLELWGADADRTAALRETYKRDGLAALGRTADIVAAAAVLFRST